MDLEQLIRGCKHKMLILQAIKNNNFLSNRGKLGIGGGVSQAGMKSSTGQSIRQDPQLIISVPLVPPNSELVT